MRYAFLLISTCVFLVAVGSSSDERPKNLDAWDKKLIAIADIKRNCWGAQNVVYGMSPMGGLDHCANMIAACNGNYEARIKYQKFKCESLRVHGEFTDGECRCAEKWKGPICNNHVECPPGEALANGVCTSNICYNGGTLSVGSTQIECSCPVPWDGRYCEQLACWRKASEEHERRWKNALFKCVCSEFYTGTDCDRIIKCKNGNFTKGRLLVPSYCDCFEGWMGEICDTECLDGMECIKNTSWMHKISAPLLILVGLLIFFVFLCFSPCFRRIRSPAAKAV